MKYLDEFRDADCARKLASEIARQVTRPWVIMEVCGGQTHAIVRNGLDEILPPSIELVHGPGCPVCVTPLAMVDRAHAIASQPGTIFCSFGDMLRVPGSRGDLLSCRSRGADVRVVYGPMDALEIAAQNQGCQVVFFAIGFETTAPANAMAVWLARQRGLSNFSVLVSHVLVPPALEAILSAPDRRVQGFLGPGHVCAVMGTDEYQAIALAYGVPIVIAGFEPVDLLEGVLRVVRQLEAGEARMDNAYARVVRPEGNRRSRDLLAEVFERTDRDWRGIGPIPASGYRLRGAYRAFDADDRFEVNVAAGRESAVCISGQILRGTKKPCDCPAFATTCTPGSPLGATMVSSEGACAAYFAHGRHLRERPLA
jgi:hydrogenase expression/formation protein HypD